MVINVYVVLLFFALICFLAQAVGVVTTRVNLQALGLAFLTGALLSQVLLR